MAKTAPKAEQAEAPASPAPKKGKRMGKLLLAGGLATVLLAGGGSAWFFLLRGQDAHAHQAVKSGPPKPPVFVNLEPFTVNLQPDNGEQYLQVVAVLRVADSEAADALKTYMPEMRHKMLLLLSSKKASDIATVQGREKLSEEMRAASNAIVASASGMTHAAPETPAAPPATDAPAAPDDDKDAAADKPAVASTTAAAPEAAGAPKTEATTEARPASAGGPVQSVLFTSFIVQ